ncbi:MAG: DUF1343 domain-containing protein [Chryseotalea sp. WA131a]|jgi:uncharacterized protein YbbC (DUF1343 family)|nr:MAG: DUF1343 domain-containing protein [Chryseotalea sp. WA131a]
MLGCDRFIQSDHFKEIRFGLLTNHSTFTSSYQPLALELVHRGVNIQKIFSPEHGINSQGEDGAKQISHLDGLTRKPVISLYENQLFPPVEDLADIEAVLIDLPNVGCRFYTYWWTITYMLEACSKAHRAVFLLDRPNLRGIESTVEGPMLDVNHCRSFLGRKSMPLTHGFSYGQLAQHYVRSEGIELEMEIFSTDTFSQAEFIPPSPSLNDLQAVTLYPFTGLFEGINVSHGRGTSFPFKVIGAPWIHAESFWRFFQEQKIPGVKAYPYSFKPMWGNFPQQVCNGLYFMVTDRAAFRPVACALKVAQYLLEKYSEHISQQSYPTHANPTGAHHLDLLLGVPNSFFRIQNDSTNLFAQLTDRTVSRWVSAVKT